MTSCLSQYTYGLTAAKLIGNSNYLVLTSPTSPLYTTSAFFVWVKIFNDDLCFPSQ